MSKKRNRNDNKQRDVYNPIATRSVLRNTYLTDIEDRRLYDPLRDYRPAKGLSKYAAEIGIKPYKQRRDKPRKAMTPDVFKFNVPAKVAICVRRKKRREVLFAKKRTGKGARAYRRRRNYYTEVSCAR